MPTTIEQLKQVLGDRYAIEREIGAGGMATVYLAEDLKHQRKVAIKVLRSEITAALGADRFHREIRIAAQLEHPNVLTLIDSGDAEGMLYYVMPYISGESLREKLAKEHELPINEAVRILRDAVDALAHAHEKGVVHRDIKPDNVLLSGRHALVTDFGVAKAVSEATGRDKLTTAGVSLGTPTYMAPEQAAADPHIDQRADIYAIGVVAYELLTGRPPFTGNTPQQVLSAHVTETPDPVTKHRQTVPPQLEQLVMRCLEKKPADRWQSAEELLPALEAVSTPSGGITPTGTQPISGFDYEAAARRSHPVRVAVLFGVGAVAVLAVLYGLVMLLGLPDWVMVAGVALVVLALPITLLTGHHERQRALDRTTGAAIPTPPGTARHLFTWKRALIGGAVAAAALAVAAGGYMAMRNLGIGPVGTLVATGRIEEGAVVILADFADNTGDSTLALTVTDAFGIDLARSEAVTLMQPGWVRDALQRMTLPPDARVDANVARELAIREGADAVIAGEINRAGGGYVLSARLLEPETGDVIEAFRETASDSTEIIEAIDRLSKGFRERVGESLRSLRDSPRLGYATTSSLEALRLYTQANRIMNAEADIDRALPLYEQAVAIDPEFAAAHRKIGTELWNWGRSPTRRNEAYTRAYELRDRLRPYERAMVESDYHANVLGDLESAVRVLQSYYDSHPDELGVLNNLAVRYNAMRRWDQAEPLLQILVDSGPGFRLPHSNLIHALVAQGKVDAAEESYRVYAEHFPDYPGRLYTRSSLSASAGDYEDAERHIRELRDAHPSDRSIRSGTSNRLGLYALREGKLAEAERYFRERIELAPTQEAHISRAINLAWIHSQFRQQANVGIQIIEEQLAQFPLDSVPPADRPYLALAYFYANAGELERARAVMAEYESAVDEAVRETRSFRFGVSGAIALAEDSYDDALAQFRMRDERIQSPVSGLWDIALAYDGAGELDSAIAVRERFVETPYLSRYSSDAWQLALTHKRLGELYEQRGDVDKAAEHYGEFVDLWKDADPELQPQVDDVRQRIARLVGEPVG
jgi:tetratricopeptide (TPR) repeat protein/tRNA A-37 threonylcarbamoyl transferase component Bud32